MTVMLTAISLSVYSSMYKYYYGTGHIDSHTIDRIAKTFAFVPKNWGTFMKAEQRLTLGILLSTFLAALDSTLMATIGPTVSADLHGMGLYTWLLTAFMAATTIAAPIFGKLVDTFSPRRLYTVGLGTFAAASLGCSMAPNMQVFLGLRFLQGIGAGGIFTLGLVMIGKLYHGAKRSQMQGRQSAMWGLAGLLGPSLGGVVAQFLSWRLLFLINVPLSLLAIGWMRNASVAGNDPRPRARGVFDYWGGALLTGSMLCMLAFPTVLQNSLASPAGWILLVAGLILLGVVYDVERHVQNPLIPIRGLNNSAVAACLGVGFIASAIMFSCALLIPLLVQNGLDAPQWVTGIVLLSMPLGWAAGSMVAGKFIRPGSIRIPLVGIIITASGLLGFQVRLAQSLPAQLSVIDLSALFTGAGIGFLIMSALVTLQSQAETNMGALTGLFNLVRNMGNALGPGLIGGVNFILLARTQAGEVTDSTAHGLVIERSIHLTLWIPLALTIVLLPAALRMRILRVKEKAVTASK